MLMKCWHQTLMVNEMKVVALGFTWGTYCTNMSCVEVVLHCSDIKPFVFHPDAKGCRLHLCLLHSGGISCCFIVS